MVLSNPIYQYLLGIIAADGFVDAKGSRIQIQMCNEGAFDMLSQLSEYFEYSGMVKTYYPSKGKPRHSWFIQNREAMVLAHEFLSFDIYNKSDTILFPSYFENDECKRMFLRGILDADGNIHVKKGANGYKGGQFRISKGNQEFMEGLRACISEVVEEEIPLKIQMNSNGKEYPLIEMRLSPSKRLYEFLYKGYEKYRLSCKYSKFLSIR